MYHLLIHHHPLDGKMKTVLAGDGFYISAKEYQYQSLVKHNVGD